MSARGEYLSPSALTWLREVVQGPRLGPPGASGNSMRRSLIRRGLVRWQEDYPSGWVITPAGRAALSEPQS